jgi:hypothetical protein
MKGSFAGEANEIAIARFVFGEDYEVVVLVLIERSAVIFVFGDVKLAAEDGLDSLLLHGVEEVDGAEDVAMIGHGGGSLADFAEVAGEFVYVAGTIEEGVISVKMEVGKLCCHAPILGFGILSAG